MPIPYRKLVRDAVVAALSDATNGFNATSLIVAPTYGVSAISFDFTGAAQNFVQVYIKPEEIELSPLLPLNEGPTMALWTDPAVDTGRIRASKFDGGVIFHLCGIISPGAGAELSNTEDILDAYEETALTVLNAAGYAPPLRYVRETRIDRAPLMPLADGFRQWFDLTGKFELTLF